MDILILTERGAELYLHLSAYGDWCTTQKLAELSGKKALSPHDRSLLTRMISSGYVESKVEKMHDIGRPALLYRAITE